MRHTGRTLAMGHVMKHQQRRRIRHIGPLVLAVVTMGGGCSKPKPTIVLDGWWSTDYAKNSCTSANQWYRESATAIAQLGCAVVTACPEMMPRVDACRGDPALEVRGFETELATQLAADPRCSGVRFGMFSPLTLTRPSRPWSGGRTGVCCSTSSPELGSNHGTWCAVQTSTRSRRARAIQRRLPPRCARWLRNAAHSCSATDSAVTPEAARPNTLQPRGAGVDRCRAFLAGGGHDTL